MALPRVLSVEAVTAGATEAAESGKKIAEALSEGADVAHSAPAAAQAAKPADESFSFATPAPAKPATPGVQQARVRAL